MGTYFMYSSCEGGTLPENHVANHASRRESRSLSHLVGDGRDARENSVQHNAVVISVGVYVHLCVLICLQAAS